MTPKEKYAALKKENPVAAAAFLRLHAREIYPQQSDAAATPKERYQRLKKENPIAAAAYLRQHAHEVFAPDGGDDGGGKAA